MNTKIIIGLIIFAVIIFGGWLFWWPITECWYAWSWEPLLSNAHKLNSFVLGAILFWGGVFGGIKVLI